MSATGKKSIIYHTAWARYGRNYQVTDLPINRVTDIAYAFYNVLETQPGIFVAQGGDAWADEQNLQQFTVLKQSHSFVLHLSIGGWTWSKNFSLAVRTAASREAFANSIVAILTQWPVFRGISLDWEYLSNDGVNYGLEGNAVHVSDAQNFTTFVTLLRSKFTTAFPGVSIPIAMCVTASPEKAKFPISAVVNVLDALHVMTYDFHSGAWGETTTAHHCNPLHSSAGLWSAAEAADFYIGQGVPSAKLFIGAAFYSRGFANTTGIGQPASGNSPDYQFAEEPGVVPFHMLPRPGAVELIDAESKGAYSYDASKKVVNTYDNPESVIEKCKLVHSKGLGGIICWDSSGDSKVENRSLMNVLYNNLTHGTPSPTPPQPTPQPTETPTPQPTETPTPGTSPCDFCTTCRKPTGGVCVTRNPQPTPTPPLPTPTPSPSPEAAWVAGKAYKVNDLVLYNSKRYKCLQAHVSIACWNPEAAFSLWAIVQQ